MRRCTLSILVLSFFTFTAAADDWPRFRGADGLGQSAEKGLMEKWPDGGPEKKWVATGLGKGYSAPSIVGDKIYVTGLDGNDGVLRCLDVSDGKQVWEANYGPEWTASYPGARSTPTVHEGMVYLMSGQGGASCWDAKTGKQVWQVDTAQKFGGRNIQWGFSESPLIVGKGVVVSPGGKGASVVMLDAKTGKTIWASRGLSDKSAYCSVGIIGKSKSGKGGVLVTMVESNIVALDPKSGRVLWKVGNRNQYAVHPNTPLMTKSGILFCNCGYGYGSIALRLGRGARSQSQLWKKKLMDNHFGGNVVVGDYVFGTSTNRPKARLLCMDARKGTVVTESRVIGKGQIILAGKKLYAYGENGVCALLDASPKGMTVRGKFDVSDGGGEHWAHPAIANGMLYIRHGNALAAYVIKK